MGWFTQLTPITPEVRNGLKWKQFIQGQSWFLCTTQDDSLKVDGPFQETAPFSFNLLKSSAVDVSAKVMETLQGKPHTRQWGQDMLPN